MSSFGSARVFGAALLLTGLAGCSEAEDPSLVGKWQCEGEGAGHVVDSNVDYRADGRSEFTFQAVGSAHGNLVTITGRGAGTWSRTDDQLVEAINSFSITRFKLNDRILTGENIPQYITDSFVGFSGTSTVEHLTADEAVIRTRLDQTMTCSRRS